MSKNIEYIEHQKGNFPVIFSSGHDGKWYLEGLHHSSIIESSCRGPPEDEYVNTILESICNTFKNKYNKLPYYVKSNIRRAQVDVNRSKTIGTSSDLTRQLWTKYHNQISVFIKECVKKYGFCFYIDLHSNSKSRNDITIGYNITNDDIKKNKYNKSSLQPISKYIHIKPETLMYGNNNLCNIIQKNGLACVPNSIENENLQSYYSGGFNLRYYKEKFNNIPIGIIQIEFPKIILTKHKAIEAGKCIAKSINEYILFFDNQMKLKTRIRKLKTRTRKLKTKTRKLKTRTRKLKTRTRKLKT